MVIQALVIVVVILPLKCMPNKFAGLLKHFSEKIILWQNHHINMGNRIGYDSPGFETALFMFHPSTMNKSTTRERPPTQDSSTSARTPCPEGSTDLGLKNRSSARWQCTHFTWSAPSFSATQSTLYLKQAPSLAPLTGFRSCKRSGSSSLVDQSFMLFMSTLYDKILVWLSSNFSFSVNVLAVGMVPLLALSYGLLYAYYTFCHPWLSEGVSLGFEPRDLGRWMHQDAPCNGKFWRMINLQIFAGSQSEWGLGRPWTVAQPFPRTVGSGQWHSHAQGEVEAHI